MRPTSILQQQEQREDRFEVGFGRDWFGFVSMGAATGATWRRRMESAPIIGGLS